MAGDVHVKGVVWVDWGPPFERAVAGDVLVPAGFGPQPLPHLCGAQLVGQRIRVYWQKDDEFYSGTVVAYDATRDDALCYQVRYDVDGELLWDALWDEERNAGFLLEGEGGDHAQRGRGDHGSWMRKRSRWVPHAIREAWLCDVYKRFGDAWHNQTTGKPFEARVPHAPGCARKGRL